MSPQNVPPLWPWQSASYLCVVEGLAGGLVEGGGGAAAADTWWIGRKHCVKGDRSLLLLSELRTAKRLVVVLGQ